MKKTAAVPRSGVEHLLDGGDEVKPARARSVVTEGCQICEPTRWRRESKGHFRVGRKS